MNRTLRWNAVPSALLLVLLSGCGSSAYISGDVTYDGEPVEKGTITFLPADGKGASAGGVIEKGHYKAPNVPPGAKIIKIEAVSAITFARSSEELAREAKSGTKTPAKPADLIPNNAVGNNTKAELKAGDQKLDFHLTKPIKKGS